MKERLLEVKLPGDTVFLTHGEIQILLKSNPDIWRDSIKRGKYILRSRQLKTRRKDA